MAINMHPINWKSLRYEFRWLRWVSRIFYAFTVLFACAICLGVFVLLFAAHVVSIPTEFITRYGNTELIYQGHGSFYGSADGGITTYIYWTQDSVQDVQNHYERFFPAFTQRTAYETIDDQRVLQQWLSTESDLVVTGIRITIAQADQSILERPVMDCKTWYESSDHPCTMLKTRLPGGTLIFFHYYSFY